MPLGMLGFNATPYGCTPVRARRRSKLTALGTSYRVTTDTGSLSAKAHQSRGTPKRTGTTAVAPMNALLSFTHTTLPGDLPLLNVTVARRLVVRPGPPASSPTSDWPVTGLRGGVDDAIDVSVASLGRMSSESCANVLTISRPCAVQYRTVTVAGLAATVMSVTMASAHDPPLLL